MKTVNSLSGGKTSSYIAVHYPADYDIFALVKVKDKKFDNFVDFIPISSGEQTSQ